MATFSSIDFLSSGKNFGAFLFLLKIVKSNKNKTNIVAPIIEKRTGLFPNQLIVALAFAFSFGSTSATSRTPICLFTDVPFGLSILLTLLNSATKYFPALASFGVFTSKLTSI